jgi:hypothetical protein
MKELKDTILEKLQISRKLLSSVENIEFNPADASYEGKIQLSKTANNKLEFHKIYNSDYKLIAWTETWIEGIKDSFTTVIVTDTVYDYLLQYVSDYDSDWGFGIIEDNEELYKQLHGLLDECDNLYVTSFEKWVESRNAIFGKHVSAIYGALTIVMEKIENTLIK